MGQLHSNLSDHWPLTNGQNHSFSVSSRAGKLRSKMIGILYESLDPLNTGFIHRDSVLTFLANNRFLHLSHLSSKTDAVSEELDHSEDDRCSKHELESAMRHFSLSDLSHLIVDTCRVNPLRRASSPLGNECDRVEAISKVEEKEEKEEKTQSDQTVMKTQPDQSIIKPQPVWPCSDIEDSECRKFLTLCLFSAMDTDLNKKCSLDDLRMTLDDEFFQQEPYKSWAAIILQAVMQRIENFEDETDRDYECTSPRTQLQIGLSQQDFQSLLENIDLEELRQIFLHLVQKRAHATLFASGAMTTKSELPCFHHKEMLDSILRLNVPVYDKSEQARIIHRQHQQAEVKLEITLLGQSLIQHDLRKYEFGRESMNEMRGLLRGECVFSELETAVMTDPSFEPHRKTIFFHSAPVEAIDVVKEIGINLLATANNHTGDLGPESVQPLMKAIESRGVIAAGAGENIFAAAALGYLTTKSGLMVGLVAHASKVPPGTEATKTRPGVFSVSMKDVETCTLNDQEACRALCSVATARCHASVVIAYQHNHYWSGDAQLNRPHVMLEWKRTWAKSLIDAGATIYVGHGQPRLLGIEIYNGCPLFFGLSSFIFQTKTEIGFYGPEVWMGCIVSLLWSDRTRQGDNETCDHEDQCTDPARAKATKTAPPPASSVAIKLTPLTLNEQGVPSEPEEVHFATRGLPRRASREHSTRILNYIQELSRPFNTVIHTEDGDEGIIGWVTHTSNATKSFDNSVES